MIRKPIVILCILLSFMACIKEVELDFDKQESLPVINTLISPDEPIKIRLSTTAPMLEELPPIVEEATIKLYENDILVDTPEFNGAHFTSTYNCQADNIYKISADIPGYETAVAFDTMPLAPQVELIAFQEEAYTNADGSRIGSVTLNIQDTPHISNYYEIAVIRKYFDEYSSDYYEQPTSFDEILNDPVFFNEDLLQYYPYRMVFSDDLFKDNNYTLKANFWNHLNGDEENMTYTIIFRSISKNYYEYRKRLIKHSLFQEGDAWELEIASVEMFSNVESGFGIVACYQEIKFELP